MSKRHIVNAAANGASNSLQSGANSSSNTNAMMANTLYVGGVGHNFVAELKKKPNQMQAEILKTCPSSDPKTWKISGESLRLTVENLQQKQRLSQTKEINGRPVEITPPWSST